MIGSMAATNVSIFSSLSTISMTSGRSCDRRRILVVCSTARMAEAHRPAQHGGAGKAHLAGLQHDGLVERLWPALSSSPMKMRSSTASRESGMAQIHFNGVDRNAPACARARRRTGKARPKPTILPPAWSHSPSLARLSVCRLNEEKVVKPPRSPIMTNWRVVGAGEDAAVGPGQRGEEADDERAGDVHEQSAPRKGLAEDVARRRPCTNSARRRRARCRPRSSNRAAAVFPHRHQFHQARALHSRIHRPRRSAAGLRGNNKPASAAGRGLNAPTA